MNGWTGGFVAVDWGTTNRRAYAIDAAGTVIDRIEDDAGILSVAAGGFAAAVAALRDRFGGKPLLLAGMIGSDRGWVQAPYVTCPATPTDLAARLCWVEPGRTAIVPGLSFLGERRADVMRGEEVQVFGAVATGQVGADRATICHPGTHTKWIEVEEGRVASFRTIMTGELFALLRDHGILAGMLGGPVVPGGAFLAGVDRGFAGGALDAELFSVRARVLLGIADAADAAAFASGLLIGCNLRTGLASAGEREVAVVGRPSLTGLYAAAITRCGHAARQIDGADAFVAGMRAIVEQAA